jgi:hypothetical protein
MFIPIILLSFPRSSPPSTAYTKAKWYRVYKEELHPLRGIVYIKMHLP